MKQKLTGILDNIFVRIIINLGWNLGLWFLVMYHGAFSSGFTKNQLSEFWKDSYHIVIASIVITVIGKWTSVQPKSYLSRANSTGLFPKILVTTQSIFWLIVESLNFSVWLIFDAWRKPDLELFTKKPADEVAKAMVIACNEEIALAESSNRNPITGYFSKSHFSLLEWAAVPYGKLFAINGTILYGKLYATQKGTFIRAWHRVPTTILLFIAVWFGFVTSSLLGFGHFPKFIFYILELLGTTGWVLFFMWLGTKVARDSKDNLNAFLKRVFSRANLLRTPELDEISLAQKTIYR